MTPLAEAPMQRERATTIYEKSKTGRRAAVLPDAGVPETPIEELIPANLLRAEPPNLPEIAEPEIVRHYNRLSRRNFDLDSGFYPLGSCTMKHNPRLNERVAALPGHARLHPAQDPRRAQGALELMYLLQESLSEICGLPSVSLQPSAGSHGELAGLLLTRAYHADRGETRTKVLAPDTSHGTNPASVTMAGYEVVKVATNERGGVDMDDLRAKIAEDPVPDRLPDADQPEHARALRREHRGDRGADPRGGRDALLRRRQPERDHGAVAARRHGLRHRPPEPAQVLQPAARRRRAGGGADRGQLADRAVPAAAAGGPQRGLTTAHGPSFDLDFERPKSIGRLRGFQGNFGVFVRSYAYILSLGADGLTEASETAVLNANYLKARLAEGRAGERLPIAFDRHCMHEFVLSGRPMKSELGLATLDLAKRLLDFGFHPPTVYFPLLVDEALMVEPTETETKESLDAFADAIEEILAEAETDPEIAKNAPYSTPVRRLDEVRATRKPVVRQARCGGDARVPAAGRARLGARDRLQRRHLAGRLRRLSRGRRRLHRRIARGERWPISPSPDRPAALGRARRQGARRPRDRAAADRPSRRAGAAARRRRGARGPRRLRRPGRLPRGARGRRHALPRLRRGGARPGRPAPHRDRGGGGRPGSSGSSTPRSSAPPRTRPSSSAATTGRPRRRSARPASPSPSCATPSTWTSSPTSPGPSGPSAAPPGRAPRAGLARRRRRGRGRRSSPRPAPTTARSTASPAPSSSPSPRPPSASAPTPASPTPTSRRRPRRRGQSRRPTGAPDWMIEGWISTYAAIADGSLDRVTRRRRGGHRAPAADARADPRRPPRAARRRSARLTIGRIRSSPYKDVRPGA